mgnify:FL=1
MQEESTVVQAFDRAEGRIQAEAFDQAEDPVRGEAHAQIEDCAQDMDHAHASLVYEQVTRCSAAYDLLCKPLCNELGIPRSAFDILLFLANNPQCKAARDIVQKRRVKPNLVSVNVDRLVNMGFLERKAVPRDRRKVELVCTPKADEAIERGRAFQHDFQTRMLEGVDESDLKVFRRVIDVVDSNLSNILSSRSFVNTHEKSRTSAISEGDDVR